ncbi:Glypican-3 [Sarcoptes scabiei]|uniref:Glypican-3 n=1 Tax=Sarcoptes scabiei TaxID=52283 RepID=A0A834R3W8_SARSC|nr:Glypican-3 [Sarcoptes scabiei]
MAIDDHRGKFFDNLDDSHFYLKSFCRLTCEKILATILVIQLFQCVVTSPIGLEYSCQKIREIYQRQHHQQSHHLYRHNHHHHHQHHPNPQQHQNYPNNHHQTYQNNRLDLASQMSSTSNLNCPQTSDPNNCCYGLDDAIGSKAHEDFSEQINSILKLSSIEHQFNQYYDRIHYKIESILNITQRQIADNFNRHRRTIKTNENLIEFIREIIIDNKPKTFDQLTDLVDRLHKSIYIDVLQQSSQREFPSDYETCLLTTVKDNEILRKSREEMIIYLTRTIEISTFIIHTLENAFQLINQTSENILNPECVRSLSQTFHCSRCSHQSFGGNNDLIMMIEPCQSVCYQTVHQCLNQRYLEQMDSTIHILSNLFEQLVNLMLNFYNPETLQSSHFETIDRAIETVIENSDQLNANARITCSSSQRYFRSSNPSSNAHDRLNRSSDNLQSKSSSEEDVKLGSSFYIVMQSLAHLFSQNRDMFKDLDKKICQKYNDQKCWNGTNVVNHYLDRQKQHQQQQPQQSKLSLSSPSMNDPSINEPLQTVVDSVRNLESSIQELMLNNIKQIRYDPHNHYLQNDADADDDNDDDEDGDDEEDTEKSHNEDEDLYDDGIEQNGGFHGHQHNSNDDEASGSGSNPSSLYDDEDYRSREGSGDDFNEPSVSFTSSKPTADGTDFEEIIIKPISKTTGMDDIKKSDTGSWASSLPIPSLLLTSALITIVGLHYEFLNLH